MECIEKIIKKDMIDPTNGQKLREKDIIQLQRVRLQILIHISLSKLVNLNHFNTVMISFLLSWLQLLCFYDFNCDFMISIVLSWFQLLFHDFNCDFMISIVISWLQIQLLCFHDFNFVFVISIVISWFQLWFHDLTWASALIFIKMYFV